MFAINSEGNRHHMKKIKPKPLSMKITINKSLQVDQNSISLSENENHIKQTNRSNGEKKDSENEDSYETNSKKMLNGEDKLIKLIKFDEEENKPKYENFLTENFSSDNSNVRNLYQLTNLYYITFYQRFDTEENKNREKAIETQNLISQNNAQTISKLIPDEESTLKKDYTTSTLIKDDLANDLFREITRRETIV